ncbi:MAG TPA: hypothetical protein VNL35_17055 [Chloroflexota bacterium]|nr:hypothetical protein [Chloroflexota bacterium]
MKIHKPWFQIVAAIVGLTIVGLPGAAAASSQRSSPTFPQHSSDRAAAPSRAADGRFFMGHGGALNGPFSLQGGKYEITVWAYYNSAYDAGNSGTCFFTGYLNGMEQPRFVSLGAGVPVLASAPYHTALAVTFPAGHYKIMVSPVSNCDWNMTILSRGQTVPAIEIVGVQSYLQSGSTFTPTTVVHMGQSYAFSVFYRVVGAIKAKPAGTFTLLEHAGSPQSSPLYAGKDFYGFKQMAVNVVFSRKAHDTPGPAVARFTITAGKLHVSESLPFTLAG